MKNQLLHILKKDFSLEGELTTLPGELDLNFRLKTNSESTYVVKLMRPDCAPELIDIQCAILIHLERSTPTILLPKVIRSSSGEIFLKISIADQTRILWILSYCPGHLLAHFKPHTYALMHSFGTSIAQLTNGLEGFEHPYIKRGLPWELSEALQSKVLTQHVQGPTKSIIEKIFNTFEKDTLPQLSKLPHSVIHNDANDYNVLVNYDDKGLAKVDGIFDFGDLAYQATICELAIALAYAILDKAQPLRTCYHFLKGYTNIRSVSETELQVLFHLIKTRLAVSVSISSERQIASPDDPYIIISQRPAKEALLKLDQIPDELAESFFRKACGYPITKNEEAVLHFLKVTKAAPVMQLDNFDCILDLSVGSLLLGADPQNIQLEKLSKKIDHYMDEQQATHAIGRYCESRRLYAAANFGTQGHPSKEKRTNHLGIDIFTKAGSPVFAPFDGQVFIKTTINLPLDYGGLLILKHETPAGIPFYTLYGHLCPEKITKSVGDKVKAGEQIAALGAAHENGGWPPHLHLQIIIDLVGLGQEFPGVAFQEEIAIWSALCPNPMLLFDVPNREDFDASPKLENILELRKEKLGYNLSLSYAKPLHIVAGFRQFLFDSHARTYLDFYNNVPHVGHQHPTVVAAIQQQAALLNTNTRYLHENILRYATQLTAKLPKQLEVCYFVNSASEANELALRIARAYTQRKDILVVESAYHGHTSTLIDISPYKHDGPGGQGSPAWVHKVPIADDYRGEWKRDNPKAGHHYATQVKEKLEAIEADGRTVAAFIAETYPSVGGQIILPPNYLKETYAHIRNHGALCIADEVQTGFGRLGKSFWAFETQDVIPDLIILGKPIGNGFPLGALITTKEIAQAFDNGMEYFSTFGGNPVACAVGLAVLEVIEKEQLQANAQQRGQELMEQLRALKEKFPLIGDVRGEGLFMGIELVRDPKTLVPAAAEASYIANRLKDYGILVGTDGPLHNVLKIRPGMGIGAEGGDYFVECLGGILEDSYLSLSNE